jgi:hypothetical protein
VLYEDAMTAMGERLPMNDEDAEERVLRAMLCLFHYNNGSYTLGECLDTALIWELG